MVYADSFNVLLREQLRVEMYVIATCTVGDAEGAKCNVVIGNYSFYILRGKTEGYHPCRVGHAFNHGAGGAADVHHRRLRQLLYSLCHHVSGEAP